MASNFQFWFLKRNTSITLLHNLTLQVKACGAMAGDGEDEGLWVLPGAEALFGDIGMATSAYPTGFFSENAFYIVCQNTV